MLRLKVTQISNSQKAITKRISYKLSLSYDNNLFRNTAGVFEKYASFEGMPESEEHCQELSQIQVLQH